MRLIAASLLTFFVGMPFAEAAGVVVPAERRFAPFGTDLPTCDDPAVLDRIRDRFAQKESEYWRSDKVLGDADRISEIGFRANGLAYIPRHYCVARFQMEARRPVTVEYQVQSELGIIGWSYGVEWCVVGFDRNLAYAPACAVLRPFVERRLAELGLKARY
jgi:hypothetical protein